MQIRMLATPRLPAALAWIAAATLAACGQQTAPDASSGSETAGTTTACQLTVGWDPWEPYSYETVDGRVSGLDVEIIRAVSATAGCAVVFRKGNWVELLGDVASGTVDVLMAATPTAERRAFAAFSQPYRDESFALFAREDANQPDGADTLASILAAGGRVGITDGYYYGAEVEATLAGVDDPSQIVAAAVPELNYRHLDEGTVDAVLGDPFVASAVLRRTGQSESVVQLGELVHAGPVTFMYSDVGVSSSHLTKLSAALDTLKQRGDIQRILDRYRG